MVQEILKRLAQAAVGLHPALVQLAFQPGLELCHDRATVSLMVGQTLGRHQPRLAGGRLVREHRIEIVDHALTFRRKNVLNLGKLSPPMRQQGLRMIAASSSSVLTSSASDITIGGPRSGSRKAQTLSRFSPAWARPAKYRQIVRSPARATKPVLYIPGRGSA